MADKPDNQRSNTAAKPEKKRGRVRRSLGWLFKPMVDVKSWVSLDSLKDNTRGLSRMAKSLFTPETAQRRESFEQAMSRLKWTDKRLQNQVNSLSVQLLVYLVMAVLVLCYAIYLALFGSVASFLLALVVCGLVLAQAFRVHFWLFQLKHRKLGCSLQEWYHSKISENKDNV